VYQARFCNSSRTIISQRAGAGFAGVAAA